MAKKSGGSTPATLALTRAGVTFHMREYLHDPQVTDFGAEAAAALNVPQERVFKTLLVEVDGREIVVGIVPVSGLLDLKAIAMAAGGKKAVMADPKVAERKTGYVVGGISPLGQRTKLVTILDESAREHDTILISGGKRGLDLELAATDLAAIADARFASIAKLG